MATKNKRVSINALEGAIEERGAEKSLTKEWCGIEFTVKPALSLVEMMTFVDNVVKTCFTETDAVYLPEIKDFAIRCSIIEMYANLSLPSNAEKKYCMVYELDDVIDMILECVNKRQFNAMINAIDDKVAHAAEANISSITTRINDVYTSFANLEEKITELFGDIKKEDISNMVSAMSNGSFDENTLVRAIYDEKARRSEE